MRSVKSGHKPRQPLARTALTVGKSGLGVFQVKHKEKVKLKCCRQKKCVTYRLQGDWGAQEADKKPEDGRELSQKV